MKVFKYREIARAAVNTLLFYEKRDDFRLKGFVVMPDHIHMVCEWVDPEKSSEKGGPLGSDKFHGLQDLLRDIKKYIARETLRSLSVLDKEMLSNLRLAEPRKKGHVYQLWQPGYYDFNILSERKLVEKLKYMYENPLRKGLCDDPMDYEFSDIKKYFGSGDPKLPQ